MEYIGRGIATMAVWLAIGYYGKYWGFFALLLGLCGVVATYFIWSKNI